ncbi:Uncharacterized protein Adt_14381 [Abeliophyllum distichum]|uniref:Uncharacterized protein n=1 Tax=Abeliophyllum distichum TaxID=126358 RepID=A0ABD1TZJ2_9LAMI
MGQMAVAMSSRLQGTLPRNTEVNPTEQVHEISIRSEIQLPEIYIKRPVANKEKVLSTNEEHVVQTETVDIKESSGIPHVKATVPVKLYEPFTHFLQILNSQKKNHDQ